MFLPQTVACFVCALLFSITTIAQTEPPPFGNFSGEEKNLKSIAFDAAADAVILHDVASAGYNDSYNLVFERRVRIKVLKEKGIQYGNVELPYYSKDAFESIIKVEGLVLTTDANKLEAVTELKRSDVFKQQLNERVSIVKFALPNVKVGSILEYRYQTISKNYGGLENWFFQTELPTLLSSFMLTVVPNAEFRYNVRKSPDLPIVIKNEKGSGTVIFEMKNVAGLRNEPYMDAPKDYLQHVDFQFAGYLTQAGNRINYMQKWGDVSRELMGESYFGKQVEKKMPNAETIIAKFASIEPLEKRMAAVHNYVYQHFSWDGIKSKFAYKDLKEVWEKQKGNSGEINLVLINLLKSAGLNADPLLVSERNHGMVTREFPVLDDFNKTLAYVEIGTHQFVIDATDEHTPLNLIPSSVLNTTAFIVHNKKGRLVELKDENKTNTTTINLVHTIQNGGDVEGEAMVVSENYGRIARQRDYKRDKEKFKQNYFVTAVNGISIDSMKVTNADNDSLPLEQQITYRLPANVAGNYKLININMFTGLEKNPFIGDNRFSNINFGSKQHVRLNAQFMLPAGLQTEELPKSVRLLTPDRSIAFTRTISVEGKIIYVSIELKIETPVFSPDEYPMVKDFYKKMYSYLDEQIVLTAK